MTSTMPDLFDPANTHEEAKADAGAEDAKMHLGAEAGRLIREKIETLAGRGDPFTSESVLFTLSRATCEQLQTVPNAMGALFREAAKKGLIERTGDSTPAVHRDARGRRLPLWRGTCRGG